MQSLQWKDNLTFFFMIEATDAIYTEQNLFWYTIITINFIAGADEIKAGVAF